MYYEQDPNKLEVYHEGPKRRVLVASLNYDPKTGRYELIYNKLYLHMKTAIPLGSEFPFTKMRYQSKPHQLFPSFLDRIPDKENPAYADYCYAQGISPDETNYIILLTTIGRRGPSTFIFEPVFYQIISIAEELKAFRKKLSLSRWDVANAFDIPELTLHKLETQKTQEPNVSRLLHWFITNPEIALAQLKITGKKIHAKTLTKLYQYYEVL